MSIKCLEHNGNAVTFFWMPTSTEHKLSKTAKQGGQGATTEGTTPAQRFPRMQSTTLHVTQSSQYIRRDIPKDVRKFSKKVDATLPGKHTRRLYNNLSREEASVLAQLRTGITRLNRYLYYLKAAPSQQCACGQAVETVKHLLFCCS